MIGAGRVEITGATSEQIGTLAAEHAIPIFETSPEAADLEDMFHPPNPGFLVGRAG